MADWDFVVPEHEAPSTSSTFKLTNSTVIVEIRPDRMGLGCSREDIQQRISENAKQARLKKLLGLRGDNSDGETRSHVKNKVDSEDEGKSSVKKARTVVDPARSTVEPLTTTLTKNQKKRLKQKQRVLQRQLISN